MKAPPARPYSAWKFEVSTLTSAIASGLSEAWVSTLLPVSMFDDPSTVNSFWLVRVPLTAVIAQTAGG